MKTLNDGFYNTILTDDLSVSFNIKNGVVHDIVKIEYIGKSKKKYTELVTYKNGEVHGPYKKFDHNETLILEANYVHNRCIYNIKK